MMSSDIILERKQFVSMHASILHSHGKRTKFEVESSLFMSYMTGTNNLTSPLSFGPRVNHLHPRDFAIQT